jgi:hypothetical protein
VNPALIIAVGLALLLTGCKEREREQQISDKPPVTKDQTTETHRTLQSMASAVSELKNSMDAGDARQHVGDLWIQTDRLNQEGANTRSVEGLLVDLEGKLRTSPDDANARRRLANELEYETEALKRAIR